MWSGNGNAGGGAGTGNWGREGQVRTPGLRWRARKTVVDGETKRRCLESKGVSPPPVQAFVPQSLPTYEGLATGRSGRSLNTALYGGKGEGGDARWLAAGRTPPRVFLFPYCDVW